MSERVSMERESIPRARLKPTSKQERTEERRRKVLGDLCTIRELGDVLNVGWRSIYDLCWQGLPYIQVGNKRLFDLEKVHAWILTREIDRSPRPVGRPRKVPARK